MAHLLTASSIDVTDADLATIAANASFLWERLNSERFTVDSQQSNEVEIGRRSDRWCEVVARGNWDTLHKRLQWEGLTFDTVRPSLGAITLNPNQPLPQWSKTLRQIIQVAANFDPNVDAFLPLNPDSPIPFEGVLLPVLKIARQKLLTHLHSSQLVENQLPLSVMVTAAYRSLERNLLQRLSDLCTKTFDFEFSQVRPFGQNLLQMLGLETETGNNKTYYTRFVHQLLQDGLFSFFQKYPVLGRLVAMTVEFWVETTAELAQRLEQDQEVVQQVFGSKSLNQWDKVAEITTSLSDPHNQGRGVILLAFESGLKLVYKPKDLGLEAAYNQFLTWCNQHSQLLEFKVIQVLNRDGYGWVEYVEHQPCTDAAAADRFYERAGMLLCLLYTLRGTDCHHENVIASGEHLVLIDMETLVHHEANLLEHSPVFQETETKTATWFWDSVLRIGLLPSWESHANNRNAYDVSGLGGSDLQHAPRKIQRWQAINTDDMYLQYESVILPTQKNWPLLEEVALSPNDYQTQILSGFERMYRFLMTHKQILLAPDGPLTVLQNQSVRFLFRATRIYFTVLRGSWAPDYLKHGVDFSIELDRLSQAFLTAQEKPPAWPILKAELRAMEQLDIPFFLTNTASDALSLKGIQTIPHYFKQPSYQEVLNLLESLDESDLTCQTAIIQGSLYARVAHNSTTKSGSWDAELLTPLTSEGLIQEAKRIAAEIETRSIQEPDGSLNWLGMGYMHEAERFQFQPINDSLYDGRSGIALFLAALYKVSGESQFCELALRALQPIRWRLQVFDLEAQQRFARLAGIGGATGVGSIIYTFVKVSQLLEDDTLLIDAQHLADLVTPELIAADEQLDVMGGSAGAIFGLLLLYHATKNAIILEKAIVCGQHLLNHRYSYEGAPKAWNPIGEGMRRWVGDIPKTGFSHGAAGIACALLRLYRVTQNHAYLEAALEGIEYEHSVFSEPNGNWPALSKPDADQQPRFLVQWCNGAPGIGLARMGSLEVVEGLAMQQDIDVALQTTKNYGLQTVDHLCCGNLGRVEVLLAGAQRFFRPDWHQTALLNATNIVARAKQTGGYQLFPDLPNSVFNPVFFSGVSGIGYELLRLANPTLPSVLLWE